MILNGQCGAFNPILLVCLQEVVDKLESGSLKEDKQNIRDIRNKIDYDSLFAKDKGQNSSRQQLLYVDSLTNIYNRRYYDEYFQGANDIRSMAVFDVDNFKHINDNYGHDVGDQVLQCIAQSVLSCVRKTDALIRYGGDEFVIVFFSMPADIFEDKLEKMREAVENIVIDGYPELHISISIGGVFGTGATKKLFKLADNMLYESKKMKNQVTVYFLDENEDKQDDNEKEIV